MLDELSIPAVGGRWIALSLDVLRTVPVGVAELVEKRAMPRPHRIELIDPRRGGLEQSLPGARFLRAKPGIGGEVA